MAKGVRLIWVRAMKHDLLRSPHASACSSRSAMRGSAVLHALGRLLESLQHTLTMVGSKHSVLRAVMSSERQGLIDWLGKGV